MESKSFIIFSKWQGWLITGLVPVAASLIALCPQSSWASLMDWLKLSSIFYFVAGYATAIILDRVVKKRLKAWSWAMDEALTIYGKRKIIKRAGPGIPCDKVMENLQGDLACDQILSECRAVNAMLNVNMAAPVIILLCLVLF